MRKLVLTCLTSVLFINAGWTQTLFTYGNEAVSKQEFLRNYQKNALNKKPDMSEPALREYLDLYSLFRMKVKEANLQSIDTAQSIQLELDNYRRQLAKTYLTDEEVSNKLIREAYDRMKEERHVAHILLTAPPNLNPADTLRIYQRADSIYNAITKKKADFSSLAKIYSDDRGSKDIGGDIGFMTALQTLYPFENAVYETEVGKVSKPFRTQLGYHIVKVIEKRPARGEVQVAQILLAAPESKGETGKQEARKRAEMVEAELKKGASFDDLVKKYSDDKFTVNENGIMPQFGVGRMVPAFEKAAFSLKNVGDISEPIQTDYGYHIIKLVKKYPIKPYDSMASQLKRTVENDARAQMAKDMFFEKIKQQNGFKEYPANLEELSVRIKAIPDTGKDAGVFTSRDFADMTKPLFTLGKNEYKQRDMMTFAEAMTRSRIMGPRDQITKSIYDMYVNRVVNDYQEHKLIEENEDFKNLMQEYRDGIMLFELMDRNVWSKASRDTVGLKSFYGTNKNKYQWEPGFSGAVYHFKNEEAMKNGVKLLDSKKTVTDEDMVKTVNSDSLPDGVTIQTGRYEYSKFSEAPKESLVKGKITTATKNEDGSYTVVKVDEVYTSNMPKSLDDARGYVVAEYQDYLEKNWNKELREKYPVKVEEKVFKSMVE